MLSEHDRAVLNMLMPEISITKNRTLNEVELKAAELEAKGIVAAEAGNIQAAEDFFNQAISLAPEYPSPYNNRAQLLRMNGGDEEQIIRDLNQAIELSDEFPLVKRQALCQRGILTDNPADFEEAAKLGSVEGRRMAVECNPYAKLCHAMLKQVMDSLYFSRPQ